MNMTISRENKNIVARAFFILMFHLLRNAGGINQVLEAKLFTRKLLFQPVLVHPRRTNFIKGPVGCIAKEGGEQHHRGEIKRNKDKSKTQTHKRRINHKKPDGLFGRQLQLHSGLKVILA